MTPWDASQRQRTRRAISADGLVAVVKAFTGKESKAYRVKSVKIMMGCYKEHLDGFARYAELADAVEKWLHATYFKHALSTAPGLAFTTRRKSM
jgi:hypothetical protein